jgi:predicted RNA-binding Zn ribbon-like protein
MVRRRAPASRGKTAPPLATVFELTSGRLCLDFTNTVDGRPKDAPREILATYADLLAWARQCRILSAAEATRLGSRAARLPDEARRVLAHARRLRESLFELFARVAEGGTPETEVRFLRPELRLAFRAPALRSHRLIWEDDRRRLDFMLAHVVRSAVELWTSPQLDRVRICAAEDCAWIFLDESRNRSRQWCDMTVCGNRAKARRFYMRERSHRTRKER